MAGVAFDLLSNIRYRSMVIRLDGDLAGEFATRFTISEIGLGQGGGFVTGLVRSAFRKVPLKVQPQHPRPVPRADPDRQGLQGPEPESSSR